MGYKKSSETRNRILKAAEMIFTERGYYETGIGDIATEAGIGRASFYYYFDDKEKAARALFDSYVEKIYAAADKAVPLHTSDGNLSVGEAETILLSTFVKYILLFKYVAMNDATRAVYFDLVNYADYDKKNIERLERTTFRDTRRLAAAYGKTLSDAEFVAFLVTSNSVAKCIFKAKMNGILEFSLLEAVDYFFFPRPASRHPHTETGVPALAGQGVHAMRRNCLGLTPCIRFLCDNPLFVIR